MARRFLTLPLLVAFVGAGCMPRVETGNRPVVVRVTGTVLYRGQPLSEAQVTFIPDSGSAAAFGQTDASGRFELTTFATGDGAVLGAHSVRIAKFEVIGAPPSDDPADYERYENQPPAKMRSLLPKHYADPKRSGLKAEVSETAENDFEFKLNAAGRRSADGKPPRQFVRSQRSPP